MSKSAGLYVERDETTGTVLMHVPGGTIKLTPKRARLLAARLLAASSKEAEDAVVGVKNAVQAGASVVKGANDIADAIAGVAELVDKFTGGRKK